MDNKYGKKYITHAHRDGTMFGLRRAMAPPTFKKKLLLYVYKQKFKIWSQNLYTWPPLSKTIYKLTQIEKISNQSFCLGVPKKAFRQTNQTNHKSK